MSTNLEIVNFKIGLRAEFDDIPPRYQVVIDDQIISDSVGTLNIGYTEFSHELKPGSHDLKIRFNEVDQQRSCLFIEHVEINGHSFRDYKYWLLSHFELDHPRLVDGVVTDRLTNYVHLGWNGTWVMPFETPLIYWLLRVI